MSKNVYSILLSDEVISQIDKVAYTNTTSRSNMINRILAEYLCFEPPEQRTKNIYETIISYFEKIDTFQKLTQQQANSLTICSALSFKYNPTINYRVKYMSFTTISSEKSNCASARRTNSSCIISILFMTCGWMLNKQARMRAKRPNAPFLSRKTAN
jgi:hypothetical protein